MKSTPHPVDALAQPTRRAEQVAALALPCTHDLLVVGGGATGLGVALDAALRGLRVVLLERHDFAKGTSSRATKLVHGGVRYLAQGRVGLVREALLERRALLDNAPHLAQPLPFVMPSYRWWERPVYGAGLTLYDTLAGQAGLGRTEILGAARTQQCLPGVRAAGLRGGVQYWDGQFDDARLALALARTAALHGALMLNYCAVTGLLHEAGRVAGVECVDGETGQRLQVRARCVVNATGVWIDGLRQMDARAQGAADEALVAPSQGVHLVVDRAFWPGRHALLVPHTSDGRVLFAVPWLGKVILGTTDTPVLDLPPEPLPLDEEVDFILAEAARYLARAPGRPDVRSAWAGLRPLVRQTGHGTSSSGQISREHVIRVSDSGLVSVTGGKWTTYRRMADEVLAACQRAGVLGALPPSSTLACRLVGARWASAPLRTEGLQEAPGPHLYGDEQSVLSGLPGADRLLAPGLSEAMVRFAARHEYARTVEDVLARRSRMLFLDARQAIAIAPDVAQLLSEELDRPVAAEAFMALARQYIVAPSPAACTLA